MLKEIPKFAFQNEVKLLDTIMGSFVVEEIESFYEFVDRLKEYNKKLGDSVILFHTDDDLRDYQQNNVIPLNMLKSEVHHIMAIKNKELAEKLKLEKGKYYVYYNPSYLNGYENLIDKGLDMHHLQALESICRDELIPDLDYLESDSFLNDLI